MLQFFLFWPTFKVCLHTTSSVYQTSFLVCLCTRYKITNMRFLYQVNLNLYNLTTQYCSVLLRVGLVQWRSVVHTIATNTCLAEKKMKADGTLSLLHRNINPFKRFPGFNLNLLTKHEIFKVLKEKLFQL